MLPTNAEPTIASGFPLLLNHFDKMCVKSASYTPTEFGFSPTNRPIKEYLKYGVINLDKTSGPSSHEVVSWVKRILDCEKTGHSGTLDPQVTGNLLVCIDRATRLVKSQQELGKQYVAILQFEGFDQYLAKIGKDQFKERCIQALKTLIAPQLQRPPAEGCAVKRVLRLREIFNIKLLECDLQNGRLLFVVDCESGTYIRTLCYHIGLLVGCEAKMLELRRTRSGFLTNKTNMVTLHQVMDACWQWRTHNDDSYLRKVVMPLEFLLLKEKVIIAKDSAVNAICYGAPLMTQGVVRYDVNINHGDRLVIVTTKGEAVALATANMNSADIAGLNHGIVAHPSRVIMDRDIYEKAWGKGKDAIVKQQLKEQQLLGEHGEIIPGKTPQSYIDRYQNIDEYVQNAGNTCANEKKETTSTAAPVVIKEALPQEDVKQKEVVKDKAKPVESESIVKQSKIEKQTDQKDSKEHHHEHKHHEHHHDKKDE